MSFKYQVTRVSDGKCVLPKVGKMHVDVLAFLSNDLYDHTSEELWKQAHDLASQESVVKVCLLPDTHEGAGVPVGSVVATTDTLLLSSIGYDISCGVAAIKVSGVSAKSLRSKTQRRKISDEIEKRVAIGVGSKRALTQRVYSEKQIEEILRYGAKALNVNESKCERTHLPVSDTFNSKDIPEAQAKLTAQLGSLGGGNHFIELQVDKDSGDVWVMVHCGSRGFGWQAANWFFYEAAKLRGLPKNMRETASLRIDEPLGKKYIDFHNAAANYAIANRIVITNAISDALEESCGATAELFYDISHNLMQVEHVSLSASDTRQLLVHRKGATRAFYADHEDLPTNSTWKHVGHPCIIPGSMYAGAAFLTPLSGSNDSLCTVNHGSGRVLGRRDAKRKLEHKQNYIDDKMSNVKRVFGDSVSIEGVLVNSRHVQLDECDEVYKDLDDVLNVLTSEKIAKLDKRLYPVMNIKGSD